MSKTSWCQKKGFATEGAAHHALRRAQTTTRRTSFNDASVYYCEARECQHKPFHIGHDYTGARGSARQDREAMFDSLDEFFANQTERLEGTLGSSRYSPPTANDGNLVMEQRWQTSGDDVEIERRK